MNGIYTPLEPVAGGGEGVVWRGVHRPTGGAVALKVVPDASDLAVHRLRAEARRAARLDHPAIIPVVDVGRMRAEPGDDPRWARLADAPCIVMAWDDGTPLSACLPRLTPDEGHAVVAAVLRALAHAHARGLVHRDVKPANVLVGSSGSAPARLTDFGISAMRGRRPDQRGTPGFVDPLAVASGWTGPTTDLYAVGGLAALVAGGVWPLGPEGVDGLARRAELRGWSPDVAGWVARACAAERSDRWRAAVEAAAAWDGVSIPGGLHAPGPVGAVVGMAPGGPTRPVVAPIVVGAGPRRAASPPVARTSASHASDATRSPATTGPMLPRPEVAIPKCPPHRRPVERRALLGAGAGLLDVREVARIGHDRAAEDLWRALRATVDASRPRRVVVDGPAGVGRSRMIRWCGESAAEWVGARFVDVRAAESVTRSDVIEAVRPMLVPGEGDRDTERWASDDPVNDGFRDDAERAAVFARILARWSAEAPVVVGFDAPDVDERWFEALTVEAPAAPILVVTTARDTARADATITLAPLHEHEVASIVRHSVGVSNRVAEAVASRSGGRPRVALDLVSEWVATGRVVVESGGLVPAEGAPVFASKARRTWTHRIESWSRSWSPGEVDGVVALLALGTLPGSPPAARSLSTLGVSAPLRALDTLRAAHGVFDHRGRLVAPELVATWLAALPARRRRRIHVACAEALADVKRPRAVVQRADHLVSAGRPAQAARALTPLLHMAFDAEVADHGLSVLAQVHTRRRRTPDDAALEGRLRYVLGDADAAAAALDAVSPDASTEARLAAFDARALIEISRGRMDAARVHIDAMRDLPGLRGALAFRADLARGRWLIMARRAADAVPVLEQAIATDAPGVPPRSRLVARVLLSHAWLHQKDVDRARAAIDAARAAAVEHGSAFLQAQIDGDAAELDAAAGDWAAALDGWRGAVERASQRFPAYAYLLSNIAWARLHLGEVDAAAQDLADLAARFDPTVWSLARLHVLALSVVAPAVRADPDAWDAAMDALADAMARVPAGGHEEAGAAAEWAMRAWAGHGDSDRRDRARRLAGAWWARLRMPERLQALDASPTPA